MRSRKYIITEILGDFTASESIFHQIFHVVISHLRSRVLLTIQEERFFPYTCYGKEFTKDELSVGQYYELHSTNSIASSHFVGVFVRYLEVIYGQTNKNLNISAIYLKTWRNVS